MSSEMKARVETEAKRRGESASVIVREALREYFEAKAATVAAKFPRKTE